MRCVNNGLIGQVSTGYYSQDNLISLMNKESAKKGQTQIFTPINSLETASNISSDKGIYDPKTGTWSSSGNVSLALQNLEDREAFNQIINDALAKAGIKLSSKEKITLTIDQDGQITVSGINDQQKKAKVEEVLNNALKDVSTGLMMHIESIKAMNGIEAPEVLEKWMVYDFLKDETGQDFSELKLVDGEIVGANEKLRQILDGERDFGAKTEYVQEIMAKLKSILATGPDKIPDLELKIDFQNGSLIDRDVKNGFGPDQLTTWFKNFISGKATWNTLA